MRVTLIVCVLAGLSRAGDEAETKALAESVEDYLTHDEWGDELQVTATRRPRDPFDTPRAITIVTPEEYRRRRPSVALDVLDQRIGIWIEKRTGTTSDPVMRGFSGSNLLALIDGNTLTTLWGEGGFAGDDMYGKLDAYLVERIEVVRGPNSVLYGSNNLGGVINFFTRSSRFDYTEEGIALGGRAFLDFSSVDAGVRGRIEHHGACTNLRWLLGVTGADNGDVRGGGDIGIQAPTSGQELDFDLKMQHRLSERDELELSLQRIDRNNTHRFYRPTQDNFNDRVAIGAIFRSTGLGKLADQFEGRVYFQHKKDTRRFFNNDRRGWAKTDTVVVAAQATTTLGAHHLTYGVSWERDAGESPDDEQFTTHTAHMDDYVKDAPDSVWSDLGVYAQDEWDFAEKWSLIIAVRLDVFHFKTEVDAFYDPPGPLDPLDDVYSDDIVAATGGIGLVYYWSEEIHLVGNVSRGFRQFAPNFGARQQAAGILMPNRLLDPVTGLFYELGMKVRKPSWWMDLFVYRTELYDFQNQRFGTFNGQDFFDFNQNGMFDPEERVLLNVSDGRAYVTGIEIEGSVQLADLLAGLPKGLSLRGGFAWNYGNDRTRQEPLRHVQPATGLIAVRYESEDGRWWIEFSTTMVRHADRIPSDRVARDPGFRSDPQDITSPLVRPDGSLPGYTVFDLRGGFKLTKRARVEFAVENLTDKEYRRLHSRMDAPGLGIRIGMTVDF
jgi:outer membrane receptor protein involved in Fe transport